MMDMVPQGLDRVADHRHSISHLLQQAPDAPARARRLTRDFLQDSMDDESMSEMLLATSELVTNALKFGDHRPIWLHLLSTQDEVAVTVTNSIKGDAARWAPAARPVSSGGGDVDLAESGRGLSIVREMCDKLGIFCGNVTMVRAARRR